MPKIEVDAAVFHALERKVLGFRDTPNSVLRRILGIDSATAYGSLAPNRLLPRSRARRARSRKASLSELVRAGSLAEGQALYLHDYQGNRVNGLKAVIRGNDLEFKGRTYSMSALAAELLRGRGYGANSYRGPQFWRTEAGRSVRQLWDELPAKR